MLRSSVTALAGAGLALAMTAGLAQAAEYEIDPAHSFVEFKIPHLGFSIMDGRFNDVSGTFTYAPEQGAGAQAITVVIPTASVDTNHAERDKHLRGEDFLNVDEYPEARFVSTGFTGDESGGVMTGDLTLHGVTKPIEIEVEKVGEGDDPWGGYRAGFIGTTTLDRNDFGISYDLGPAAETVDMTLMIEGVRQ
ncbi:YceI family protein [Caenispirillum salinarum]|uniref:YceI family protein n=1 Tax=Caenispirillum salinarum TaxID=859058 RepID=UPI00384F34E3